MNTFHRLFDPLKSEDQRKKTGQGDLVEGCIISVSGSKDSCTSTVPSRRMYSTRTSLVRSTVKVLGDSHLSLW